MHEPEPDSVVNGSRQDEEASRQVSAAQKDTSPITMEPPKDIVAEESNGKKPAEAVEPDADADVDAEADADIDAAADEDILPPPFSWLEAHPSIVIILTGTEGENEQAFAIQKDFLCAKSSYFRKYFRRSPEDLENVIKFPDVTPETFGFVQNFLFTNEVYPNFDHLPGYEVLINIWKVGHDLGIDGLCDKALEAMQECRQITQHIPATPLLVQVWNETPEGSTIRTLLLGWAAEYMRSSEERAEFAKSLPKEVLSELVVAISSLGALTPAIGSSEPPVPPRQSSTLASPVAQHLGPLAPAPASRKNVHYMAAGAEDDDGEYGGRAAKKAKRPSVSGVAGGEKKAVGKKAGTRQPPIKQVKRRSSATGIVSAQPFSTDQKLDFCSDLLARMLSGPGFWTRLVGPFKHPVVPEEDGVPDYFDKVKKPMDLGTVKYKMDNKVYTNPDEFASDVRQIFENCFTYWNEGDAMWETCVKFQKTFEEKYSGMDKWITKMSGHEGDDH